MADSPTGPGPAENVAVGRILGAHGVDGALNVRVLSDVPGRFQPGRNLLIDQDSYLITNFHETGKGTCFLWLQGISRREQALKLQGQWLSVPQSEVPDAEEGEYFHYQLLGLNVRTDEGEDLGELEEVLETGSNDVYIVRSAGVEILVPAIASVVLNVDLTGGVMTVRLPEGLR